MKPFLSVVAALTAILMTPLLLADQSIDERRALASGGNVFVENVAGEINVTTWDRDELHLTGTLDSSVEELEINETFNSGSRLGLRVTREPTTTLRIEGCYPS